MVVVVPVVVELGVVALVVGLVVVALINFASCSEVNGATYLITYLIESTVFTSTTLLPFLIMTFAWPLANDPPLTLILICFASNELRTNAGETAGNVPSRSTASEVPLIEIFAAA